MNSIFVRVIFCAIAILTGLTGINRAGAQSAAWLDESKPAPWNKPGLSIPAAPQTAGPLEPRCRALARPAETAEDERLRKQGWDLVGAYQGGWQIRVVAATAGYDGMCRPMQYQYFVFVRDVFAGTLSPRPMDSRTDGAIFRVFLQNDRRLTAEYERYAATDPLCCPSKTTSVEFEIAAKPAFVRAVSTSSAPAR
jgi:hypothetical protein